MHLLASHNYDEFLATPQLARFDFAEGSSGNEPTLLIKANTLLLKYVVLGAKLELLLARLDDRLFYGVVIYDDPAKPTTVWSVMEREQERRALHALAQGRRCQIFLFNELAVNVAWTEASIAINASTLHNLFIDCITGSVEYDTIGQSASELIGRVRDGHESEDACILIVSPDNWNAVHSTFFTNTAQRSLLHIFSDNEGDQQEQIAIWLTDNLHPDGAFHSPQIKTSKGMRELTDILMTYQYCSFLIESKTLSLFSRAALPDRDKLIANTSGDVSKALRQLRGALRSVSSGLKIFRADGSEIEVDRKQPNHAIVLLPDFDLFSDNAKYNSDFIKQFLKDTNGILHIIDTAELLRMTQAAEMLSRKSENVTPMMALDFYLCERAKKSIELNTLCFGMLLKFH